ncbi:MAG: FAD-dependent oxidoreductase [Ferruginibacter sp.]
MKDDLDLAIIGAGIIGVCAAWYARKKYPAWRIALFDQAQPGSGATFYSAALDLPYGHTPFRYELSSQSRLLFDQLRKDIPALPLKDLKFYGFTQEHNADKILQQLTAPGIKASAEMLPLLHHDYPFLKIPPNSTVLSGGVAMQALNNEVTPLIARHFSLTPASFIFKESKVLEVNTDGDNFHLRSANAAFQSKRIIQATGPWITESMGNGFAISKKPRIKKIVAFHIYQQPEKSDPVFYFFDDDAFLMPRYEAGYWLFSFRCDHWDVLPNIASLSIDPSDTEKALSLLDKYAPSLVPLCTGGRVFCDAYTENADPIIETAGNHSNYVIAGAGAGSGFRLAPAIASKAVDLFK